MPNSGGSAPDRPKERTEVREGKSFPIGPSVYPEGINFSVFSKDAEAVELLLFDRADDPNPSRVIALDPGKNRTYHYWHALVPGLKPGQIYGYRVTGPNDPSKGYLYDPQRLIVDPYGCALSVPEGYRRLNAGQPVENMASAMKSVVPDPRPTIGRGTNLCTGLLPRR